VTLYLDLHVLQSLPPSNVNRDDTGSPKTATFGGMPRARVSSQAWKRAMRKHFETYLNSADLGVRSKRLLSLIAARVTELEPSLEEKSLKLATDALSKLGIDVKAPRAKKPKVGEEPPEPEPESEYLVFLSNLQVENLAQYIAQVEQTGGKFDKKATIAAANTDHSIDLALFGRMVADLTELRVDASAQVAHAIGVHGVEPEFDYYTAVDDVDTADHAGAGMIGTIEFNSSLLYRYATLNVDGLADHLGDPAATGRATGAFVNSFVRSMPSGKQNTFAHRTLPHAVVAVARTDQPVNLVGAFENAVTAGGDRSRLSKAAAALVQHSERLSDAYGRDAIERSWVVCAHEDADVLTELGESVSVDALVEAVDELSKDAVGAR